MDENKTHNQQNSNENKIKNTESKIHDQLPPLSDEQAEQSLDVLYEISRLMNCGIPRDKLGTCMQLIELGVHPQVLADIIHELQQNKQSQ